MQIKNLEAHGVDDLLKVVESGDFTHSVVTYEVKERPDGLGLNMHVIHCAFFDGVPNFADIVSLFMNYAKNMEFYGVTEEMLETMYVRVDSMESLKELLSGAILTKKSKEDSFDDGWAHGIAGRA